MKKELWQIFGLQLAFVLILWLVAIVSYSWAYDIGGDTVCEQCSASKDGDPNFAGFFDTESQGIGAINTLCGGSNYVGSGGNSDSTNTYCDNPSTNNWRRVYRYCYNGPQKTLTAYFKDSSRTYVCSAWIDTDGDGIINDLDPWPEDDQPFTWKRFAYCKNASDEIAAFTIRAQRADGETVFKTYGDPDDCTQGDELDLFSGTHNGSVLQSYFASGGEYASFSDETAGDFGGLSLDYEPGTGTGFTSGTDDTGNSTDSERLSDIVNNTKSGADNVARLGDYLKGIGDSIEGLNETISGSSSGVPVVGGSSDGGVSSEDIETGVDGAIQDAEGRADDELTDGLSGLPGSYDFSDDASITGQEDEFGSMNSKIGDADSNGVADGIDSIRDSIGSNNLVDALQNSGVQLSGAECLLTMDTHIFGNVDLDFCVWASAFDTIGTYTVALSWMVFMMIVFL